MQGDLISIINNCNSVLIDKKPDFWFWLCGLKAEKEYKFYYKTPNSEQIIENTEFLLGNEKSSFLT